MTSQQSTSENPSCHNEAQHFHQASTMPSSAIALGKNIVCKCLQSSSYSIHSSSSSNEYTAKSNDGNFISSNPWLKLTFIILVSLKLQLLFEHSVCLLSLIATRYLAGKKRERHFVNEGEDNAAGAGGSQIHLVRTVSSSSDYVASSTPTNSLDNCSSEGKSLECCQDDDIYDYTASSNLPPPAIELSEDSQNSTASMSTSQTWSQKDLEILSAPSLANEKEPPSSSFLPSSMDISTDEWGQFADFDEGYQNDSPFLGAGGTRRSTSVISEDPYRSISKAILKRRGDKLSVCKLGQLQEEENEDDFD